MSRLSIVIDAPLPAEQAERLRALSPDIELLEPGADGQALYTAAADRSPDELPSLEWIQLNSVAIGHVAGRPLLRRGLPVANACGAYTPATAECAIAMLLAITRKFEVCHRLQQRSEWPADPRVARGVNCYGKTLAIAGYGSIGRHVARMSHAMGMRVLACKRDPRTRREKDAFRLPNTGDPEGAIPEAWFGIDQLPAALARADAVIVTLPATRETLGVFDRPALAAMNPDSYLVNVGRGGVVDEEALAGALRSGHLAAAALDVFATEPLPAQSALWKLPNLLIVPHLGSYTVEQAPLAAEALIENARRHLAGQPLLNLVDVDRGY